MADSGGPEGLARLIGGAAAALPAAQAQMDERAAPAALRHAASPQLLALLGRPRVGRLASASFDLAVLVGHSSRGGATLSVWPLSIGFALLHGVAADAAARLRLEVTATQIGAPPLVAGRLAPPDAALAANERVPDR